MSTAMLVIATVSATVGLISLVVAIIAVTKD